jgi:hypothetical protein
VQNVASRIKRRRTRPNSSARTFWRREKNWFDGQLDLDPSRLIFIDESGLNTRMARLRGRLPPGARCRAAVPHEHWKSMTFTAGLRLNGIAAPWVR